MIPVALIAPLFYTLVFGAPRRLRPDNCHDAMHRIRECITRPERCAVAVTTPRAPFHTYYFVLVALYYASMGWCARRGGVGRRCASPYVTAARLAGPTLSGSRARRR